MTSHLYQLGFRYGVLVMLLKRLNQLSANTNEAHFDKLVYDVIDLETYDIAIWKLAPDAYGELVGFATRQDGVERYQPTQIN